MKQKNIIDFYMLVNQLKYIKEDQYQSIAEHIYGAMTLATVINSEYHQREDIGKAHRMILLDSIDRISHHELEMILKRMLKGKNYQQELKSFYKSNLTRSDIVRLAFSCSMIEKQLSYFLDGFLQEEQIEISSIEELFHLAETCGIASCLGKIPEKNYEIFRFYYLNRILKQKTRSAWDERHWNITIDKKETIAEHVVGTIGLATAIGSESGDIVNINKVSEKLANHEIGEIIIGDKTPFDGISEQQKQEIEHKAMKDIIGNLSNGEEMLQMLYDFDARKTYEDEIAYLCDKLEADIQAKVYQDMGYQRSLDDQANNIVMQNAKVQEIISNGAREVFDVWYEYDKLKFEDKPIFNRTLQYIKRTKL